MLVRYPNYATPRLFVLNQLLQLSAGPKGHNTLLRNVHRFTRFRVHTRASLSHRHTESPKTGQGNLTTCPQLLAGSAQSLVKLVATRSPVPASPLIVAGSAPSAVATLKSS